MGNPSSRSEDFVPVVDLSSSYSPLEADRKELAARIERNCRTSGFFVVQNHRVPEDTVSRMLSAVEWFFALPEETKMALIGDQADPLGRGYIPLPRQENGLIEPDRHEVLQYNRFGESGITISSDADRRLLLPNRLPDSAEFVAAVREYYCAMESLALHIMRLFAMALELPVGWFDDKFDNHTTTTAMNYYPALPEFRETKVLRKAAHSDWGTLTVLYQDDESGLQVLDPDGRWLDVPPRPGTFVVNIGELMTRWTNNRWSSTVHRVVAAPGSTGRPRYSVPFFYQPNYDAVIECIPTCVDEGDAPVYPPILSHDYFGQKARRARIARLARR
jgi:isopenicillin N synthase-like dioxygenase